MMKPSHRYLLLAVIGAVGPYSQFIPFLMSHGLDLSLAGQQLFATRISAFFGLDVLISAVVVVVFIGYETQRRPVRHAWAGVLGTVLIGVSFGLPFFLFLREQQSASPAAAR